MYTVEDDPTDLTSIIAFPSTVSTALLITGIVVAEAEKHIPTASAVKPEIGKNFA
jgi:hypothetical protein